MASDAPDQWGATHGRILAAFAAPPAAIRDRTLAPTVAD